ncbi:TPA: hypothetical protein DCZ46_03300 [Candidatus Campbellbacteria bacterium]|nr:MAG: hypothetical protein UR58_C0001G0631 [Candidatus Campbellbacteria bacterium GW2011_OD1_34_28]KKP74844.1 MAG: hypothetical protein UR74_C0002G0110 [Candidatus Campbellbacteria bacterium GW2011_GWD2_35_24]KKP75730.1 MAG: hypothetical protein UR75_C0002G0111 [Candidatus Campbellbacteria bacterium GW2011_GWC2_35_28]KKP77022.1 MAG: hypothetical protein UR76_C0002G0223 [Candidatus Campbellbacteria bacterium GW2011_GWC1_35_31]KKP78948.1 MAG: hypothetical protein UR79_C0002G0223 [Candidatus Cam
MSQLKTVAFGNGPGDVSVKQALLLNTINRAFLHDGETGSLVKVGDRHDYHFCREGEKSDFFIQFHKGLGSHGTMSLCSNPVKGPEIRKKIGDVLHKRPSVMFVRGDIYMCWWPGMAV